MIRGSELWRKAHHKITRQHYPAHLELGLPRQLDGIVMGWGNH